MSRSTRAVLFVNFLAVSILWILCIKCVDVYAVGPDCTEVGFSSLNMSFRNLFDYGELGYSPFWYNVTKIIGYISILICVFWGCVGNYQMIREKSFNAIDKSIIATGILYVLTIALYVFFEVCIINYRPVIMPDETAPEASFPSSHTMLAIVAFGSMIFLVGYFLEDKKYKTIVLAVRVICIVLMVLMVVGRLVSGVHWLTDIIGGVLISGTLLSLYSIFADV